MNYLFFDLECCDGKHICEFGYVIIDENFNVLKKEFILIRPEKEFNLKSIQLNFLKEEYEVAFTFKEEYERIKNLLKDKNYIILSHSLRNDIFYLQIACKRYKTNNLNFKYYDTQEMYQAFKGNNQLESLKNIVEELKITEHLNFHRSDHDAYMSMRIVQKMCNEMSMTLKEFLIFFTLKNTYCLKNVQKDKYIHKESNMSTTIKDLLKEKNVDLKKVCM